MDKKQLLIFGGILIFLLILFFVFVNIHNQSQEALVDNPDQQSSSQNTKQTSSDPNQSSSGQILMPEQVVRNFYDWYINQPNPLKSGAYKTRTDLTSDYKEQIEYVISVRPNSDPLICAENKEINIKIGAATYTNSGSKAVVIVHENTPEGRELHSFRLNNSSGKWIIEDVNCIGRR